MKLRRLLGALCAAALLLAALPAALAKETAPFTDWDQITHQEAVAALCKLGLMDGKSDGSFDPEGHVTRAEAARTMALILTGGREEDFSARQEGAQPAFPDIAGHWAERYIEFCADNGIAFPQEDGNFDPSGDVTLLELLRMVETTLGYDADAYLLTDTRWAIRTDELARSIGLYDGLEEVFSGPVSRDTAAQILCNALLATPKMVKPSSGPDGSVQWLFVDATKKDGTPSALLYERYGYNSWEEMEKAQEAQEAAALAKDATRFPDWDQITHQEAVAALCRLGVVNGRDDGAFHPQDTVTRAEAAKLITLIMCGGKGCNTGVKGEPTFPDTKGHWAEPCIEYCADMWIISGRGDGTFDPDAPVSILELVKMAETALGYDADTYLLNGARWAGKTDELARSIGLYDGLEDVIPAGPASRDTVAQVLCNALLATPRAVKPSTRPDGSVQWLFVDSTKEDGTPSTLLYERFALDELPGRPE